MADEDTARRVRIARARLLAESSTATPEAPPGVAAPTAAGDRPRRILKGVRGPPMDASWLVDEGQKPSTPMVTDYNPLTPAVELGVYAAETPARVLEGLVAAIPGVGRPGESMRLLSGQQRPLEELEGTPFHSAARFATDPLIYVGLPGLGKTAPTAPTTLAERESLLSRFPADRPLPMRRQIAQRFAKGEEILVTHPDLGEGRLTGIGKTGEGDWLADFGDKRKVVVDPKDLRISEGSPSQPPMPALNGAFTASETGTAAAATPPPPIPETPLPGLRESLWTSTFDRATGGMGRWMDRHAPGLNGLLSRSKYHAFSPDAGDLYETFRAAEGSAKGAVADVVVPAEAAVKAAAPDVAEMEAFFRYASSRSDEMPNLVRDNPAVGNMVDYYNATIRPELVEVGGVSEAAAGQFDRYLPNILTAEMDKPHGLFGSRGPRGRTPGLRKNHPGVTMMGVSQQEAQAIADSVESVTGARPEVVGPYGKTRSYVKYANPEDRDAFVKALEAERRGAGINAKYQTFEKIPEEWLEKAVEEGGGGLVKDPMALLAYGMSRDAEQIVTRRFFQSLGKYAEPMEFPGAAPKTGFRAVPNTPTWGALAGQQVPDKLWAALSDFEPKDMGVLRRMFAGGMRAFKTNAIVKMATGSRNAYDNLGRLSIANRLNPGSPAWVGDFNAALGEEIEWARSGVRPSLIKEFQESGGIMNGGPSALDGLERMKSIFDDTARGTTSVEDMSEQVVHASSGSPFALQKGPHSVAKDATRGVFGGAARGARAVLQGADIPGLATEAGLGAVESMVGGRAAKVGAAIYNATDDVGKIAFYRNWKRIFAKENPDWSVEQVARAAAKKVNERTQVYSMRSPLAQQLSDTGIIPFAQWWGEKVRVEGNVLREDPVRWALIQAQGSIQRAAGGAALVGLTGVPAATMWSWIKRNPGMVPVSVYQDEQGSWRIVGWRHQFVSPDPVAAAQQFMKDPSQAMTDLAMEHPLLSAQSKVGAIQHGPMDAKDPTFGESRPLLQPGETKGAAILRMFQQGLGSAVGPMGAQTAEAENTIKGLPFKSKYEARSPVRSALAILAGISTQDIEAEPTEYAAKVFKAQNSDISAWRNKAIRMLVMQTQPKEDWEKLTDADLEGRLGGNAEYRRIMREALKMKQQAYREALERGAPSDPEGERLLEGAAPGGAGR